MTPNKKDFERVKALGDKLATDIIGYDYDDILYCIARIVAIMMYYDSTAMHRLMVYVTRTMLDVPKAMDDVIRDIVHGRRRT